MLCRVEDKGGKKHQKVLQLGIGKQETQESSLRSIFSFTLVIISRQFLGPLTILASEL